MPLTIKLFSEEWMDKTYKKKATLITHSTNNGKNPKPLHDQISLFIFIIFMTKESFN